MATHDRHGRAARSDTDVRRRPSDGFRTAHRRRFAVLVQQAVGRLPGDLRRHLAGAELAVLDVPDPDGDDFDLRGDVTLARLDLPGPGAPAGRLTVFRRPLELRAQQRTELSHEIGAAIAHAVQDALGLPRDED